MTPDEYLAQSRQQQAASVKQTAFASTQPDGSTPDQYAADMKLGQSLGLPTSLTSQFRDTFAQKMMAKRNETILSANPRLATWMQDKDNAKLASDDLTALSGWEQFAKGTLSSQLIELRGVPAGAVKMAGTTLEGTGQLLTPADPAGRLPLSNRIVTANQRTPEEIAILRKEIFKQGEINPQVAQSVLSDVLSGNMSPDEAYQSLEPLFEPALKAASQALQKSGEKTQDFGGTVFPAAPGMEDSFGRQIGEGLGSMLALLGVGMFAGPVGAGTAGGLAGAGEAAGNARKAGQDEDTQTIAALYGIAPGMTDAIPIERLLGNPVVKGAFAAFLRSVGKQTALEGGQEAVQQLMQNAIASSLYAPDKDMLDDVMSSFATGGAVGAIVEAGRIAFQAALPGRVRGLPIKAQQAEQTKAKVDQLGDMAVNSKLRQRMDGSFLDFVDKATEGTPIQDVYVPAEKLNELFQSFRYNPEEFLTELPGVDFAEWETALATGGDLKIPTAVYAAKLAGGEMDAVLRENMKFDPDGMTFSEAQDFNARAEEIQMEAFEQSEAARVADEATRQVDQQEYDEVVSRLRTAGRATDVAKFEAMPLVAMRRTMAERSGLSQEEFAAKYPLPEIRGAVPEGMQTKNVDELTRQLAELRSYVAKPEKNGPSLLEAISDYGGINDVGGELKARDAAVIKRGRGKKNLKLARGGLIDGVKDMFGVSEGKKHGIDDVAQAMIEAGYLQDNPAAIAYRHAIETGGEVPDIGGGLLEAIDEELRGNVQYSGNREVDPKASWADDTVSYLDSLGVSLDDSDDVIRVAIAKGQDAEGQKYGQPAFHGTPHLFEKFSLDRIGTGEGAQAFGWGLYFAGNKALAAHYRKVLSQRHGKPSTVEYNLKGERQSIEERRAWMKISEQVGEANGFAKLQTMALGTSISNVLNGGESIDQAATALHDHLLQMYDEAAVAPVVQALRDTAPEVKVAGRLYEVDLPEDAELIAYDEKLVDQPPAVQDIIRAAARVFADAMGEPTGRRDRQWEWSTIADGQDYGFKGRDFYDMVSEAVGGDKPASQILADYGIPGHRFLDGSSRKKGEGNYNYVIYDDNQVAVKSYEQPNRGSIQLPTNGAANSPVIISLFESADLSTFNHEAGHYFLNILQDMATPPGVSQDVVDMYGSVKGWWRDNAADVARDAKQVTGVDVTAADVVAMLDNGTSGDTAVDSAIDTGLHEQFARGFEAYLMEGKAPSIELRSAFERFAQWLVRLYRSIKALDVNITPEIQSVFDRLVATDAEIDAARSDVSDEMLFAAAEAAGVSPDDYRQLVKLHEQSIEAATQKLRKEVMGPIQRETEKAYKVEKAKVRDEVEGQINGMPVYRAWEWLGNRRWFGEADPTDMPDMRFDRGMLVDRYGEGVLKTLPRGKFTLYANEGGMDPDEAAGWFGFKSGDDLVKALEQATPRKDAIAAETERVMLERHGDVLKDGQIEERAIEAVHNDKRGQFLAAELKILKARAGDTSPDMTISQAREAARQTINKMQVRDAISSNRFLTAERKAANEAVKLARLVERENLWSRQKRRDVQSAVRGGSLDSTNAATVRANVSTDRYNDAVERLVEQKRRQLLNHMLYSESVAVAEEIEKAERFVSRLGKKSTRDNLAFDYLEAIDELLERYDFRKLSLKAEQRKGSLLNYVARMTAEGRENELSIPDAVLNDAKRRPYKRLSVDELRGVVDTLKNIEHTARLKQKLKDAKRERDLDAVVGDILAEFEANVTGDAPSRAKSGRGGVKPGFRSYLNIVKTADTILREIDGFKDGAAYRHIKAPIDDAMNDLTIKRREAGEQFEQLYSVYTAAERRAMTTLMSVPELNGQFSKWDLISLAFNVGNEGNYQRLTDERVKGHFTTAQIELALLRLEQRDWEFVQSAWDLIGSYWPEIEAREKRVTGVAPEKIAPREVQTKFGKFKGGYFPLKYDAEISSLSRDDDLKDLATAMAGGRYGKAQTRNGHTKERAQSSGRPVLIDIGVLHGHVNQVVHDLALSETVANSWRILQNDEVKSAFLDRGLKSDFDSLEVWVQDVAAGEIRGSDFMNRWARKMKSGFTVSKLAFNLTTVLLQPTGIAQSMVVVGKKNLLLGMTDVFRRPLSGPGSAASQIIGKSAFMRERETTFNKDIYDLLGDTKTGPSQNRVSQFTSDILAPWGFWLMQKAQFYTVDMPTWLAGFRQATDAGKSEADAIAHADRIVARAAASGNFSDRSPIERGSLSRDVRQNDVVRLFTALGSYMFAKFNVAYERTQQTQFTDPRQVLSWTTDMVMLCTVEAVLAGLVRGQLPWGDDDDDDKDGWAEYLAKQTALSITATLPFIRDLASGVQGFSGGGAYGSIMDTMARPIYQASQGEVDKAFVRSVVDAGGLFLHAPSTQINRFIDAAWRQSEGDDVSPFEYIMGKSK